MSLLNRPRLQPPSYELPGMTETRSLDAKFDRFDPPIRDHRDIRPRELGSRPRHLADRGNAAKAFSPRGVRNNLANEVLEDFKDEKYGIHQYVTHKGIIDDATDPGRPRGGPGRPTYPASPVIIASGVTPRSERTGSREAPLSARPKAPIQNGDAAVNDETNPLFRIRSSKMII